MKSIPTSLLNEIRANVTTLATCVIIRRQDGQIYRLTNHDTDLVVEGNTYRHDLPFNISAIASGSSLNSDNTELTLFMDGTVFTQNDFNRGAFNAAEVTILLVNFQNTAHGSVTMREGWFGPIDTNKHGVAKITIYGLLKILDSEIGRVYQPSCDADFGDRRCKVALRQNQTYNIYEPYSVGAWVYKFDPALATVITLDNPSFETGTSISGQPIPGWESSPNNGFSVVNTSAPQPAVDGTNWLFGGDHNTDAPREEFVVQQVDLVAKGLNAAEIDAGQVSIAYFANLMQTLYLFDPTRIRMEVLDADENVIDYYDDGYITFDVFDQWRERSLVGPLLQGARYVRLYIYFIVREGVIFNAAADNVRLYWWNHITDDPFSGVIYKLSRIVQFADSTHEQRPTNHSFEAGSVTNSNTTLISGWTRNSSADWWQVVQNAYLGQLPPEGIRTLIGGDDSSGIQQTYQIISDVKHLVTDFGQSAADIDLGHVFTKLRWYTVWYDTESAPRVVVDILDESNNILSTIIARDYSTVGSAPVVADDALDVTIPVGGRKLRITLFTRSPVASSAANVGFDAFRWYLFNAEKPRKDDPQQALGKASSVFSTTVGSYSLDGNMIWKAHALHYVIDAVATISDRKTFTATNIDGGTGAWVTATIRWLSGNNAGEKNLVRLWDGGTKQIKLYFPCTNDIQVGDRFLITRPCHKRFLEDCILTFDNAINFRGFPHLPGNLTD